MRAQSQERLFQLGLAKPSNIRVWSLRCFVNLMLKALSNLHDVANQDLRLHALLEQLI